MKPCLKQCSRAPSPANDQQHPPKHVAFGADGSEEVFFADEWDRTPTEPSRNLSYQDILELKEIQRSLPRAIQPADLIGSRPASHYLSTVPIGLLPLLPESDTSPTTPTSNVASTMSFSQNSWRTVRTPAPSIPNPQIQSATWHPAHLAHLPAAKPPVHRPKGRFAFLPLLDSSNNNNTMAGSHSPSPTLSPSRSRSRTPSPTPSISSTSTSTSTMPGSPPPSERSVSPDFSSCSDVSHDPPTPSLTNASLDSSPLSSRASSCSASPEPTFLQLPPSCAHGRFCGGAGGLVPKKAKLGPGPIVPLVPLGHQPTSMDVDDFSTRSSTAPTTNNANVGTDLHDYRRPVFGASRSPVKVAVPLLPLGHDSAMSEPESESEELIPSPPSTPTKKSSKKKNVIVINDIEIELDEDDDAEENQDQDRDVDGGDGAKEDTPPAKPYSPTPTSTTSATIVNGATGAIEAPSIPITSPTPTRPFTQTSPPSLASSPSKTFAAHSPVMFKRSSSAGSAMGMGMGMGMGVGMGMNSCSPPRGGVNGDGRNALLVPSA